MKPVDYLMASVKWRETGVPHTEGLPYTTHEGELDLLGTKMRCYRLSDGRAILHADDVRTFFGGLLP